MTHRNLAALLTLRQFDPKATALSRDRFQTQLPFHAGNSFLHDCQSDSRAGISRLRMEPFEYFKDPVLVFRRDANTVVFDADPQTLSLVLSNDSDGGTDAWRDEFYGVPQQVGHDLGQQGRIGHDAGQRSLDLYVGPEIGRAHV